MKIKDTRLYEAAKILIIGDKELKSRVVSACQILNNMGRNDIPMDLRIRLDKVLEAAGAKGALRNSEGQVVAGRDKFVNTAINRRNSSYRALSEEIYDIYLEELDR
jgi:hypothetical protein